MSIGLLKELFVIYIFYCSHISTKLIMNKRIFAFRIGSFSLIKQTKIPFKILSILCFLSFISFTSFYSLPSSLSLVFLFLKFSQVEVFQKEPWFMRYYFPVICSLYQIHTCSSGLHIISNICLESFLTCRFSSVMMTYSLPSYNRKVRIHYYFILFCLIKIYFFYLE